MAAKETDTQRPNVPLVRIFLSSPGDVAEERGVAREFIKNELPYRPAFRGRVAIELIAWDDPAARIPMLATETPQESVNAGRPRPATCEIVIVILWARMGTPLPDDMRKPDGERYLSGTEWEYLDAVNSTWQPKPRVLLYRRTEEPKIGLRDPKKKEKEEQFELVEAFFARFCNPDGSIKAGVNEYATPTEFKELLRQHLDEILHRLLPPATMGGDSEAPSLQPTIPPEYVAWLRRTCADVSLLGQDIQNGQAITLSQVYVPALTRPTAGDPTPLEWLNNELDRVFEQERVTLLERLNMESLYVPAPAGAGKSTFCRWAVLQSIAAAPIGHAVPEPDEFAEPEPESLRGLLPLLVPLREFSRRMDCDRGGRIWLRADLEDALAAWIDAAPPPGLSGALMKAHLDAGSAFLLFDGLDEVPPSEFRGDITVYPRELLVTGLAEALPAWHKAGNRVLLTSRPYGLDEAGLQRLRLPQAPLKPLPPQLQGLFVARWFYTLGRPGKIEDLIATIRDREDLAPLVENPMLLTALCVLYDNGGRLPDDRYDLYKSIIASVLHNRYPGDASQREPALRRLEAIALGMHEGEATSPRMIPALEVSWVEVEQWLARFAELSPAYERGQVEAAVRREELLTRSGLLLPRPNERAAFHHSTFQDFLAAQRIARTRGDVGHVFRTRGATPEWRSTLLFLFAAQVSNRDPEWGLALLGCLSAKQDRAAVKANPLTAVFIADALDLCLAKGYRLPETLAEAFRRIAVGAIEDEVSLRERHALALTLGQVGDPRIFDLRDPAAYVEVPAGTYPSSAKGEALEIEAPFLLGKYPVTNSQYRAFMDDDGYAKREYWSDAGWAWLQEKGVDKPLAWDDRRWNGPNQPVVGVSFWEAEACCRWAGGRLQKEREWEAANSDSGDSRKHWGDGRPIKFSIFSAGGQLMVTAPVGLFPSACGPQLGLMDINGNAWEWCDGQYNGSSAVGPINNPEMRVLRGGSFAGYWIFGKISLPGLPTSARRREVGFRCVLALPRQPVIS